MASRTERVAQITDDATFVGDGSDGVYYRVAQGHDGWYVSSQSTCPLLDDDGPYESREEAEAVGRESAERWCRDGDVAFERAEHPISEWREEVASGETLLGYGEWAKGWE